MILTQNLKKANNGYTARFRTLQLNMYMWYERRVFTECFTSLTPHSSYHVISGVTGGGGRVPPRDFRPGNFCWPTGKKEARKKEKGVKIEKKRRKIVKGKVENWKWKVEKLQNEERTFFFFFLAFQNHYNLFWVYQNENFLLGKSISRREKNQEKLLCPLRKIFPLNAPAHNGILMSTYHIVNLMASRICVTVKWILTITGPVRNSLVGLLWVPWKWLQGQARVHMQFLSQNQSAIW